MKKLLILLLCILLLSGCAVTYDGPTETRLVLDHTISEFFWGDGTLREQRRTEYAYDIYGNEAQTIVYVEDEAHSKTVNRYDENGNLLRTDSYSLTGWLPRRTNRAEYTYDDQGRILTHTSDNGTEIFSYTIEYDDEAHTQTITYGEDHYTVQYYDPNGYLMRVEAFHADGTVYLDEYTRQSDGQRLTLKTWINGELTESIEYENDDQGRPISQKHYEGNTLTSHFRWEYDDENLTVTQYLTNGDYFITGYYEDGRIKVKHSWNADGTQNYIILYRYREIRVPVKEETP